MMSFINGARGPGASRGDGFGSPHPGGATWRGPGRLDGVVATIGPGGGEFSEADLARFDYGRGREAVGAEVWDRAIERVNAVFEPADAALHRAVPEPHWYLDVIAVDPSRQGRGIGSGLLRAVNARADADRAPVVLLTFQLRNLGLYERHGYAVVCQGMAPTGGPQWWGLRRNPVA